MLKTEALQIITAALPETGVVDWETVYASLQSTAEGRIALGQMHALRRDKNAAFYAKYDRKTGVLNVSRQPFPEE
jgi:hypothetical protein